MSPTESLPVIAHAIQLAIAPVLLLLGGLGCFLREVGVAARTVRLMSAKFRP